MKIFCKKQAFNHKIVLLSAGIVRLDFRKVRIHIFI